MALSNFRWKDPRNGRVWEVGVCSLQSTEEGGEASVLCFDTVGTPRAGHGIYCCPGVRRVLRTLDDQMLALCLEAAVDGGYLWVDPRDDSLWWVRSAEDGTRKTVRFVGSAGELDVDSSTRLPPSRPESLMALRDRARPPTAA